MKQRVLRSSKNELRLSHGVDVAGEVEHLAAEAPLVVHQLFCILRRFRIARIVRSSSHENTANKTILTTAASQNS